MQVKFLVSTRSVMTQEIFDLVDLVRDPNKQVSQLAANALAGLSLQNQNYFLLKDGFAVKALMQVIQQEISADVLKTLINLSAHENFALIMADVDFLNFIILLIILPTTVYADLCCMLLNNLSKFEFINSILLKTDEQEMTGNLDNLLEVFARGEGKKFNQNADFNYLSGVFANISSTEIGSKFFLGDSRIDSEKRLLKIIAFIGHTNSIRKIGVLSVLKNCCFNSEIHCWILTEQEINILPLLLLPLAGPEDLTEEESNGLPDELLFLEPDKKRESNPQIRLLLVEILLLLCSTRESREILRDKKVYSIVQKLHLVENDDQVVDAIDRLVQFLVRDEEILQV